MNERTKLITNRIRLGWGFLAFGVVLTLVGIMLELRFASLPYRFSILTGAGILWAGIGIGMLVRYRAAMKDSASARRLTVAELDERSIKIRTLAGYRAYWVSTGLVYIGLMWASFAANGSLPDLSGDVLWYFLAAGVVIPFGVYISSIITEQRNS